MLDVGSDIAADHRGNGAARSRPALCRCLPLASEFVHCICPSRNNMHVDLGDCSQSAQVTYVAQVAAPTSYSETSPIREQTHTITGMPAHPAVPVPSAGAGGRSA